MQKYIDKANILIEALPYIQHFAGKTVVVKYGGNAMISDDLRHKVMEDIALLKYVGVNPIIVHGGGPDISAALKTYQIESKFINGLRVTDEDTMRVAQMVLVGKTNKEIVSMINLKGGNAVGLCGIDGSLIRCKRATTVVEGKETDIGFVGEITEINCEVLEKLATDNFIPVVAPIGVDEEGQSYNINADTVAGAIAAALGAEKLLLLTDVDGIKYSPDSEEVISHITKEEIYKLIDSGVISGGMIPKTLGCIEAIDGGVNRVHILDGRIPHSIVLELFTDAGIGTMISK